MDTEIRAFCRATGQRVVRSFAAALVGILTANSTGLLDTDWKAALSTAGMAAVVTLLLCIGGGATSGNGPSFGAGETTAPASTVAVDPADVGEAANAG